MNSDSRCGLPGSLKPLGALPRTTIRAPLDLGPNLLIGTHHAAFTAPYHRGPEGLEDVLRRRKRKPPPTRGWTAASFG